MDPLAQLAVARCLVEALRETSTWKAHARWMDLSAEIRMVDAPETEDDK
jgi:hypothetical protein